MVTVRASISTSPPCLDYVSPVCLPFSEMMTSSLDSDPEVAGWGAVDPLARRFSDVLQYVIVPLADKEDCVEIYKVVGKNLDLLIYSNVLFSHPDAESKTR